MDSQWGLFQQRPDSPLTAGQVSVTRQPSRSPRSSLFTDPLRPRLGGCLPGRSPWAPGRAGVPPACTCVCTYVCAHDCSTLYVPLLCDLPRCITVTDTVGTLLRLQIHWNAMLLQGGNHEGFTFECPGLSIDWTQQVSESKWSQQNLLLVAFSGAHLGTWALFFGNYEQSAQ